MCWQVFQWDQDAWWLWLGPLRCFKVCLPYAFWALDLLAQCACLRFPQVLMIISSDNRKTQRWNQLHYCLWSNFQEPCFKYGLWIGNRVWNKEKRKGSKQCFPRVTYFTWFFHGENQVSLSPFIDEEPERRHLRAKGPAKHNLDSGLRILFPSNHSVTNPASGSWTPEVALSRQFQTLRNRLVNFQ